jgi:Zn-dependent M28 family amino/carboxypeptidase
VFKTLRHAGYEVRYDAFEDPIFRELSPTRLDVQGLSGPRLRDDIDYRAMLYSASGRVTAPLLPLDFDVDGTGRDGPGCEPSTFDGMPKGQIVLLRPGPCFTRDQVVAAADAGAAAVLLAYPEFTPRLGLRRPTLLSPEGIGVPAIALTDDAGRRLAAAGEGATVSLEVRAETPVRKLRNVIAQTSEGDPLNVVIAGGHLDSVIDGPGINDNGSGVATLLEVAEELAASDPQNKVRFAFWAGEEYGLLGSRHYVDALSPLQIEDIAVYLNFDMLGSPNHVPFVYDNSGAPEGSDAVTDVFMEYLASTEEPGEPFDLTGRSDHFAFEQAGVRVGGLFSGAEELKTEEQASDYGGEGGEPLDACYHQACDDIDNIDVRALELLARAAADAIGALATDSGRVLGAD